MVDSELEITIDRVVFDDAVRAMKDHAWSMLNNELDGIAYRFQEALIQAMAVQVNAQVITVNLRKDDDSEA